MYKYVNIPFRYEYEYLKRMRKIRSIRKITLFIMSGSMNNLPSKTFFFSHSNKKEEEGNNARL